MGSAKRGRESDHFDRDLASLSGRRWLLETRKSVQIYWSDGRLRRFDFQTGLLAIDNDLSATNAGSLTGSQENIMAGTFLSGGRRLCVSGIMHGLQIAEIETGKMLYTVPKKWHFTFSHDERLLAVWKGSHAETNVRLGVGIGGGVSHATRSTIFLLNGETGQEQFQIDVPDSSVWALAFSPDDKTIAWTTGWAEGQIHLYDLATHKETRTINTPAQRTSALAFTPDGSHLLSGMADTSVLVWEVRENGGLKQKSGNSAPHRQ